MKIKFDDLPYQKRAIDAVVNVFKDQEIAQDNFTVTIRNEQVGLLDNELGIGNRLDLIDDEIERNINQVQLHNILPPTKIASGECLNLTIEMETGTGKTYVYLRTAFELNKKYGFTKFIIVVPSLAIKEGVKKSFEIMKDDFKLHYENVIYNAFVYDSGNPGQIRAFATSSNIEIMIINIDAFRKSFTDPEKETTANLIHRKNDKLSGYKPIEFIQQTNPIVIIDEPQSVDTTPKAKEAIASLNPLCILRYSATHKEKMNLVYKLDSVQAYEEKLVKQIEVISVIPKDSHNRPYIKLVSVNNKKSPITAKLELDVLSKGKITRTTKPVKSGDDLAQITGRELYEGFMVGDIYCGKDEEYIDFANNDVIIRLGETYGDVDYDQVKRMQIRKTIEEHLNKELKLTPKGIKVLSLFFIDKVENYRIYDEEGNPQKGKYALMFEEEYHEFIKKPKYHTLFNDVDTTTLAEEVHNGYFSVDKKGKLKDTKGNTQADEDVYALIMKDKEKLLSFKSKLKFIFSHSMLKEGWDNPNVFQICTLNETKSEMKKRQEIGRGLRLAVNQEGQRVYGHDVNTLTVMVNESYEEFASKLQAEIEEEEGIKFGVIDKHIFATMIFKDEQGEIRALGTEASEKLWNHLKAEDYIDAKGNMKKELKLQIKHDTFIVPEEFSKVADQVKKKLMHLAGDLKNLKDGTNKKNIVLKQEVFDERFKVLWDKIKYKTTYSVNYDTDELIVKCVEMIKEDLKVSHSKIEINKVLTTISKEQGVVAKESATSYGVYDECVQLPDILTYLQNETQLTRKTIAEILVQSGKLELFKKNPSKFMQEVAIIIKRALNQFVIKGIKYTPLGEGEVYTQEIFETTSEGYLDENIIESNRSIYNYVKYDSGVERSFAQKLEQQPEVKVYAKLPDGFKIDTPIGGYNPDWAIIIEKDGIEELYFIVETKGTDQMSLIKDSERGKIHCAKQHFKDLGTGVKVVQAHTYEAFSEEEVCK